MTARTVSVEAAQLDFLNKLQRILNEGLFTASYKYALLLALAELSVEKVASSDGSLALMLDEVSERFITLYWRQTAPFAGGTVLLQNTGTQASAINKIAVLKERAPTLAAARKHSEWRMLVRDISRLLLTMPLWKLQRVGSDRLDFLYEERLINRAVVLRPGVAACFKHQFMIVQALVQMAWLAFVQKLPPNRPLLGPVGDLADFLFGAERNGLRSVVDGLNELQKGACFYCGRAMQAKTAVDHFIPWSRYPRDLGHNFVLADHSCNLNKRDMLAAPAHLERWVDRNCVHERSLREIFDAARFVHDVDASTSVAEWSYETAEHARALVWVRGKQSCPLSDEWRRLFLGSP